MYKDVFSLFDDDNDGIISTRQLGDVLRKLGMSPTEGEVNEMIEKVDCDGKKLPYQTKKYHSSIYVFVFMWYREPN